MPAPRYTPIEEETLVLDAAAKCIRESSLLDFKMSAIANEAGISMGSVYKHVQSKEDVLIALATRMLMFTHKVLENVMALPLSAPERLISTILLDPEKIHEEPFGVHLEMMIGNEALLQRASPRWVEKLSQLDQTTETMFIDSLLASADLNVRGVKRGEAVEALMLGLWSMHSGFVQVAYQRSARGEINSALPFPLALDHALVTNAVHLINAYPWEKPLSKAGIKKAATAVDKLGYR